MIAAVVKLDNPSELVSKQKVERINLIFNSEGLYALSWLYQTEDHGRHGMVKRRGGKWDYGIRAWTFPDRKSVE